MAKTSSSAGRSAAERFYAACTTLLRQIAKFGIVGFAAYIIDIGLFNLLCHWGSDPLLQGQPFLAKVISTVFATIAAWLGNRYWTFRATRRDNARREFVLYVIMCTIGLGISLGCLWISHQILGLTSPLADNISANVVGLGAATAFRFWAYHRFVFTSSRSDGPDGSQRLQEDGFSSSAFGDPSAALSEG